MVFFYIVLRDIILNQSYNLQTCSGDAQNEPEESSTDAVALEKRLTEEGWELLGEGRYAEAISK